MQLPTVSHYTLLLWYYCMAEPFPDTSTATDRAKAWLIDEGYLCATEERRDARLQTTPKAKALVQAILALPLPVQVWIIPTPEVR